MKEFEFKFELGQIVVTRGVHDYCVGNKIDLFPFVFRHRIGDWGEVCKEDKKSNDEAVRDGLRILSAYTLPTKKKIWIITEWDRSVTTILFPDEY